jgi:hypothetical protein
MAHSSLTTVELSPSPPLSPGVKEMLPRKSTAATSLRMSACSDSGKPSCIMASTMSRCMSRSDTPSLLSYVPEPRRSAKSDAWKSLRSREARWAGEAPASNW